jgi:hypothetical protein
MFHLWTCCFLLHYCIARLNRAITLFSFLLATKTDLITRILYHGTAFAPQRGTEECLSQAVSVFCGAPAVMGQTLVAPLPSSRAMGTVNRNKTHISNIDSSHTIVICFHETETSILTFLPIASTITQCVLFTGLSLLNRLKAQNQHF